jgi:imidazolonepropionase-like amidohydrolase
MSPLAPLTAASLLLLAATPIPVAAQDFAITGATVVLGDGSEPIENGTVVVRGGRVTAAGAGVSVPAGITAFDGSGSWVTPGLFSAVTDLGLWDVEAVDESNDTEADDSPFGAALDVAPAINPASQNIAVSRVGGVTRATVTAFPAGSIFAGQGAVIDLGTDPQAVIRPRAFQLVVLGEQGGRIAGGSRVAAHALFRNALREALDLDDDEAIVTGGSPAPELDTGDDVPIDPQLAGRAAERQSDVLLTRFDAAALMPVVTGQQKLYVAVDRAADIRSVLALKQEFPRLDLVLVGAAEGWTIADEIAASGVPVLAEALVDLPASFELIASTQSNVGRMKDAGVKVALGGFLGTDRQPRWATQHAGNLVALNKLPGAAGLSWGEAFAAISSIPAEISGYGGQAGVLAPGAAGDVVVWDGDPLEVGSNTVRVYIDGVEQPLINHQTRLRDRYRDLDESDLPKAYDW